jgi:hypothetical protein
MLRRLFTILSALSLLLCVAMAVLWPLSYPVPLVLERMSPTGHVYAAAGRGGLYLGRYAWPERPYAVNVRAGHWKQNLAEGHDVTFHKYSWNYGFGERRGGVAFGGGDFGYTVLRVPLWFAAAVFAVLPAVHGARAGLAYRRQRKGLLRGLCPSCGYDLRATPGRCPECGAVATEQRVDSPSVSAVG